MPTFEKKVYNHTRKLIAEQGVDLNNLKVLLMDDATFDATDTAVSELAGSEVSGNGWTAGGEAIANVTITTVDTNGAKIDGDDITVTATGGSISASAGVVIDDTNVDAEVLVMFRFLNDAGTAVEARTADQDTDFKFTFSTDGILTLSEPA